jgi:hypothetical protein
MTTNPFFRSYPLDSRGGITHWLSSGLITSPLDLEKTIAPDATAWGDDGRWVLNYWAWDERSKRLKQRVYESLTPPPIPPYRDGEGSQTTLEVPLHARGEGFREGFFPWKVAITDEDQVIDLSAFNFTPTLMQGWLHTHLQVDTAFTAHAELLTIGPARVFLNGALITHFKEPFSYVAIQRIPVALPLIAGMNTLHLHGEMLGWREARLALGLRFQHAYSVVMVVPHLGLIDGRGIPQGGFALPRPYTPSLYTERGAGGEVSGTENVGYEAAAGGEVSDWQRAEEALSHVHVKQFAFPTLPGKVYYDAAASAPAEFDVEIELPIPENVFAQLSTLQRPKASARIRLEPGGSADLPLIPELTAGMSGMPGENSLMLTMRPVIPTSTPPHRVGEGQGEGTFHRPADKGTGGEGVPEDEAVGTRRASSEADVLLLKREIWAGRNTFSSAPYGDYESRRREALRHLAAMPYDVPAALAALEIGAAERVPSEAVALACHFMEHRYDCADFYAIGLLALLYRYGESPALATDDRARIERAFLGFKYWLDEPGLDAMCYFTENHQILFHVAAYLAGQLWQEQTFSNSGRSGREQMERNLGRIEMWILNRLRGGFSEWDSNAYMTLDAFAMLALVEFADILRLRDKATALLDKLLFMLACQSFRGALGSTHGRCYVSALKSARVENTSALGRIAWGMGIFNGETRATGLLATARRYRVPEVIQKIGADAERMLITRARSYGTFLLHADMRNDAWSVDTLTYRTSEVMLSAALDHRPGEMGIQEHLWQATLSPEANIFTTYPGNSQEHGNARPNFWAGSARLPRVAMHDRTVICLYRLEPEVGLGISHAYFPTAMFDEWHIDGAWAFARVGGGYVALWGDGDLVLTARGRHVAQELRSSGEGAVWVCRVGRVADDGSFADFQYALIAHPPTAQGTSVEWATPEGTRLAFAWEGALRVDGAAVDWADMPHYDNAYTHTEVGADAMMIEYGGERLVLDLQAGRRTVASDGA